MVITSIRFLEFCLCSVALFLIFPPKHRWMSLLISSIRFYLISSGKLVCFILLTSVTSWYAARMLEQIAEKGKEALNAPDIPKEEKKELRRQTAKKRKTVVNAALVVNIGLLILFKVSKYFTAAFTYLRGLFTGGRTGDAIRVVVPLGISYYTFSTVGYLLDVYWKRYSCEDNFLRYLTFAIYYPHIIQGPISRYNLLGAELKKPELRLKWNNVIVGLESILLGMFKKLVIADRAAIFVAATLKRHKLGGWIYLVAMILDAIQIYTDFSGYMDIVSGISKIFDVELEQNFNHPFLSKSVPEFWRRWHMSLGSWFRDYVYYPITLSRPVKKLNQRALKVESVHLKKLLSIVVPVYVTWLLTGLWHGTGIGYVAWGIYYGTIICFSTLFSEDIRKMQQKLGIRTEVFSYRVFQTLKIFCIFIGGRFLGTSMGMKHKIEIIKRILFKFMDFSIFTYGLDRANFLIILFGVLLLIRIAVIETKENIFDWFNRQNYLFCAVVLYVLIFSVFLLGIYGEAYSTAGFMYRQY